MNQKHRDHVADALKTLALGQFAVFGYTALQSHKILWLAVSLTITLALEAGALCVLRKREARDA